MKKHVIPSLVATALACCTFTARAQVTLTANPADYGVNPTMFTLDPELYSAAQRGITGTRHLRQTFQLTNGIAVNQIIVGAAFNGTDGGLVINFYEVADVNAGSFSPGTLVHTITLDTSVDLPSTSVRLQIDLSGADIFPLERRDTGTEGYAIEFSNYDDTSTLGSLRHSYDGTEHYTEGRFYTESGSPSGTGRDLGIALSGVPLGLTELTWAAGSGIWDIATTVNWSTNGVLPTSVYNEIAGVGNHVVFEDSVSGASPITVTVNTTVSPASVTVSNSSKDYTFSGTGSIAGTGGLMKSGNGTLTLNTSNSYSGFTSLNGGTTIFSSLDNLGSSGVLFDGGTLQYNGNTDDLSARTLIFAAGGATIDIGANDVSFLYPVGGRGAGGLTKLGTGKLVLVGTDDYFGDTVIGQGILGTYGTLSNSPNIVLSSGTVFDVTPGGFYTLSASAHQTLSGVGSVNGDITAPAGTTLSPTGSGMIGTLVFSNSLTIGGTLELDVTTGGNDTVVVGSYVMIDPGAVLSVPAATLTNGQYKLIEAAGGLYSPIGNFTFTFSQPGKSADLVVTTEGAVTTVYLEIDDAATDDITWAGTGADWDSGTANWHLTGTTTPWSFTNGNIVRFDEVGAAIPFVYLQAAVRPSLVVVSNTTGYVFSGATGGSKISGAARLLKQGPGLLDIYTVNDNTGSTTVEAGTLTVYGSLGSGGVTNNAELILSQASPGSLSSVSGSGNLTQSGADVTIAGTADYTGSTTVASGALQFGTGGPEGVLSTSAITNDGTLILNSSTDWTYSITETGSGTLVKQGPNVLTITAPTTRTGETRVESGKVILGGMNQLPGDARIEAGGTLDINGYNQTFPRLLGNTSGRLVNNGGTGTNVVTIANSATSDSSVVIADNDGTGGVIAVVKDGDGELILRANSTYTGGTTVHAGSINMREDYVLGTGLVTLHPAALRVRDARNVRNPITIPTEGTVDALGNIYFNSMLTGDSNSVLHLTGDADGRHITPQSGCNFTGFHGTLYCSGAYFLNFRQDNPVGGQTATWNLGTNTALWQRSSGRASRLGLLLGGETTEVRGHSSGTATYIIGGKNLSGAYYGSVLASGSAVNIIKEGTGSQTLAGTNTWNGTTQVDDGTLVLTGTEGNPTNTSGVFANSPGTLDVGGLADGTLYLGNTSGVGLGGDGTINGSVAVDPTVPTVTVTPGNGGIGTLTLVNTLTLNGSTEITMEVATGNTSDQIAAGTLALNGAAVTVTNTGGSALQAGDTFQLFNQPVGGLGTVTLPTEDEYGTYTWTNNLGFDGSVSVATAVSKIVMTPTNLVAVANDSNLELSWPASHTGWTIESNSVSVADAGSWYPIIGSASTNFLSLPFEPGNTSVFFRMMSP